MFTLILSFVPRTPGRLALLDDVRSLPRGDKLLTALWLAATALAIALLCCVCVTLDSY